MDIMIDLHTHSTASDGSYPPKDLVDLAAKIGLASLALTDHDTLAGLDSAANRAGQIGIHFIPGIEIEIERSVGEFHLLGLCLDGDRNPLEIALHIVRQGRHERNLRMIEKFRAAGMDISLEELLAQTGGGRANSPRGDAGGRPGDDIISRAHFARLFVAKGITDSIDQAFSRYLAKGKPFYEPRPCLSLADAVSLIREAGGLAVIAHPISLELKGEALRQLLEHVRDIGVTGIEAYHPGQSLKEARKLELLGRRLGFLITGGSDFHGAYIPQRRLGRTSGGLEIPGSFLEAIRLRLSTS
jgi:hypothetical protein